jgi:hypothetical protein
MEINFNLFAFKQRLLNIKLTYMDFENIVKLGVYYYPANKHYAGNQISVVCDRCNKSNLVSCIGYKDKDLCLSCADMITQMIINTPVIIRRPERVTKMAQKSLIPSLTFMENNIYKNNK